MTLKDRLDTSLEFAQRSDQEFDPKRWPPGSMVLIARLSGTFGKGLHTRMFRIALPSLPEPT